MTKPESKDSIPVNLRVLRVLELIARADGPVSPLEVSERLCLPKPTTHRLILTLENEGYIQREINRRGYIAGSRMRTIASSVMASPQMQKARLSILSSLAEEIGETCNIAMPDNNTMTYVDRVESKWPLRIQLPIGSRVPLYATASGKLYLSTLPSRNLRVYLKKNRLEPLTANTITDMESLRTELKTIARRGYSTDDQEFIEGMIAVAVPIANTDGLLVATLSFHAPEQRLNLSAATSHLDRLFAAAGEIGEML